MISSDVNGNTVTNWGGGIYNNGTVSMSDTSVEGNTATNYGGGINNGNNGTCTVSDSTVTGNTADYGGGINNYGICIVNYSSVNDNTAYGGGGILNQYSSTFTVIGSSVNGNNAGSGGGILNYSDATVIDSSVEGNTASNSGGGIYNYDGTLTVAGSDISYNTVTNYGGGIFNRYTGTCNVIGSSVNGNTAYTGAGVYNYGTCNVIGSAVNGNTATNGGGIYNEYSGTCTVINSTVNGNTATNNGGGIYNFEGSCTVSGSSVTGNNTINGGGIYNEDGTLTIFACDFTYNRATGNGNAIWNSDGDFSNRIVQFCRFYDPATGYEIYCDSGAVDAQFNWWCSDTNPSAKVSGSVDVSPWLVLTITANPSLLGKNGTSDVTVDLLHDSDGGLHDMGPNGIFVTFTTNLGSITPISFTVDGVANATFTGGSTDGVANINAVLDGQVIRTTVTVDATAPTVTSTDPTNGATNVTKDKVITITFSENVVMGTGWIELLDKTNSSTAVDFTSEINGNVLTITPTKALKEALYKVILHTGCLTDLAGNPITVNSFTFSVGTSPTITSTSPLDGATNVNVAKTITVTFSEAIRKSSHFWVELVDNNGNAVAFTTYITGGNMLVIDPTANLAPGTTYKVKLHTGCVTDLAGNPVAPYIFSFTTRNT